MKIRTNPLAALAAALALAFPAGALAQAAAPSAPAKPAASQKAATQRTFASPEEAAKALAEAVKASDVKALLEIAGPQSKSWLFSGDDVSDREDWAIFSTKYASKNAVKREGDKATLHVGDDDFPFAAPIVKRGDKWAFDAEAGREEVINRRVGRNELDTIQTLLAVVDAQREYAMKDADGNGLPDYAARFISTVGKKDGLYWPTKEGEPRSPLGPLLAKAVKEGYGKAKEVKADSPQPYNGYLFRPLMSQGRDAPGGKYEYVVNGRQFGGFAVLAQPAKYGASGVMTFIVNHDGVVYEKDLGPATAAEAAKIKSFNPDKTWRKSKVD